MKLSRKTVYDKLAPKVNNIDNNRFVNNRFVLKTEYDTVKPYLEKKLLDTNGLAKKQIIMLKLLNRR